MKPFAALLISLLLTSVATVRADFGLLKETDGVWDREGGLSASDYPYARGQSLGLNWAEVNPARSDFNWSIQENQLRIADARNQVAAITIGPVGGGGFGLSHPAWISEADGGGVPFVGQQRCIMRTTCLSPQFLVAPGSETYLFTRTSF